MASLTASTGSRVSAARASAVAARGLVVEVPGLQNTGLVAAAPGTPEHRLSICGTWA